jgi:transcriptional regulator with XRE-family HTH domain
MITRALNGATVRVLRELLGISQRDLAARCGITQGALSNIERGVSGSSGPLMPSRIAEVLGVPIDAIAPATMPDPALTAAETAGR